MEKILFFTSNYYPEATANGICSDEIMQELINRGFEVHLICYGNYKYPKQEILNGVHVNRVRMPIFHNLDIYSSTVENFSLSQSIRFISFFIKRFKLLLYLPLYPMTSLTTVLNFYRKANKLQKVHDFKMVISSYNPIEGLITGFLLKRKFKKINYVMYILDSLSNTGSGKFLNSKILQKIGWHWENIFYANADQILLMKSHETYHKSVRYKKFKNKMEFVDIPLLTKNNDEAKNEMDFISENQLLKVVYTGGLDSNRRNPRNALAVFSKLNISNLNVSFYSRGDCENIIKEFEEKTNGKIERKGLVSHEESLNKIKESNFLLSIGNLNSDMIPSKIFEYMAAGKPIIHFYKDDRDSSVPYLLKYPLVLLINENEDEDVNSLKIKEFMETNLNKKINYEQIKNIFIMNTPEFTVDKILRV